MNIKFYEIIGLIMAIMNAVFNAEKPGVAGKEKQKIAANAIQKNFPEMDIQTILEIVNHIVAILNLLKILKD